MLPCCQRYTGLQGVAELQGIERCRVALGFTQSDAQGSASPPALVWRTIHTVQYTPCRTQKFSPTLRQWLSLVQSRNEERGSGGYLILGPFPPHGKKPRRKCKKFTDKVFESQSGEAGSGTWCHTSTNIIGGQPV